MFQYLKRSSLCMSLATLTVPTVLYHFNNCLAYFDPLQNMAVTDVMQRVANEFNCSPVEGMMSQQLKKNTYDTDKIIILNPSEQQR